MISLLAHSHVAKTGDIRDFVIIEESGIAKGIRRIIAITGEEARQACLDANELEQKWDRIVKLEGIEKEKGIKGFEVVSYLSSSSCYRLLAWANAGRRQHAILEP